MPLGVLDWIVPNHQPDPPYFPFPYFNRKCWYHLMATGGGGAYRTLLPPLPPPPHLHPRDESSGVSPQGRSELVWHHTHQVWHPMMTDE